jgi:hypothetical protein
MAGDYYKEKFVVRGTTYGIEDYEQKGVKHFMPHLKHKRFHNWAGGCGIGDYDTIADARGALLAFITRRTKDDLERAEKVVDECDGVLEMLDNDPFNLSAYKVKV